MRYNSQVLEAHGLSPLSLQAKEVCILLEEHCLASECEQLKMSPVVCAHYAVRAFQYFARD